MGIIKFVLNLYIWALAFGITIDLAERTYNLAVHAAKNQQTGFMSIGKFNRQLHGEHHKK